MAERLALDDQEPGAAGSPVVAAAAHPAAHEGLGRDHEAATATLEQAAQQQEAAQGGVLFGLLEGLRQAEARALRLLKAWLDAAPSGGRPLLASPAAQRFMPHLGQ